MLYKNLIFFCLGFLGTVIFFYISDYILDPYGIKEISNKRVENLLSENSLLVKPRIEQKADFYLIGTSRTLTFDLNKIKKYSNKDIRFLGISGSSISQWNILIEQIKKNQGHIILGLDIFSLNNTYDATNVKSKNMLLDALSSLNIQPMFYFLNSEFIKTLFMTEIRNIFLPKNNLFNNQNQADNLDTTIKKTAYSHYFISSNTKQKLLSNLDAEDIIILFPEYYEYYDFYLKEDNAQKNKKILDEYLDFVIEIVTKTDAKVWSFMGINEITLEKNNFKDSFHFKPKVADLMIEEIFNSSKSIKTFGVLLDKKNIHKQIKLIKNNLSQGVLAY